MFGTDTLTFVSQGRDWRGDPVGGETTLELGGCYVQPNGDSDEDGDRRTTVTGEWLVFAPLDAAVTASMRCRINTGAELYEVQGDPLAWAPPGEDVHHLEIILRKVKG